MLLCRSEYGDTKSIAAKFLLSYQPATDQSLDAEGTVAFLEEGTHGYSRLRFQAVAPGTRRFIYRHRLAGSNYRSSGAGAHTFRDGALRAGCAHPLAHPSAWPDARGYFRFGRVQVWGGKAREIRPGDVVWIPPSEKHWHGAGPNTVMVHVAMQEALDGKHVEWMEPVTDEQYKAAG
jgi:hypothetical protein